MGSPHDPRQPAYRPLPPPPRMRWAVVRAPAFKFKPLAWCVGWAFAWFAEPWFSRVPMWVWGLVMVFVIAVWRLRLVRVPVEPPRVRVEDDGWDLDTQRRIDALMREGLVEVETVKMPSARKGDRHE